VSEQMKSEYDIIILGAGPGGLSTALHLAKFAPYLIPRILLLEKERFPRPKLCAGGLVADAEVLLEQLGLDVTEIPHVDADVVRFDFEGNGLTVSALKRHTLRIIRRDEFDAWLAAKTRERGITIQEGTTVQKVQPDAGGVSVTTDRGMYYARAVVGADGSNGVTRRCALTNAPVHTARLLEVLTPIQPASEQESIARENRNAKTAVFDFFPLPKGIAGYAWDFPTQVKGQPMRCWGIYDTNLLAHKRRPPLAQPLAQEMAQQGFDLSHHEIQGHPIRWFDPRNPLSAPRVLLVGDAAGVDPIFGEGISLALGYGKVAARELINATNRGEYSFHGYKQRVLRSALGQTLIVRWGIARILYRLHWAWFQKLFWRYGKPVILPVAWLLVLNWARRLR